MNSTVDLSKCLTQYQQYPRTGIFCLTVFFGLVIACPPKQLLGEQTVVQPAGAEPQLEAEVSIFIEQLGDPNFRIRSNAQEALEKIGLPAFEQLRRALEHPNIQVARSAEYLLLSQNVVWWLDTDSHEAREQLLDYSALANVEKETRLQQLALLGTDDALLALCRIAKYENNEWLSRSAALYLLNCMLDSDTSRQAELAKSILLVIQQSNRRSTLWLSTFCNQVLAQQPIEMEPWSRYADELNLDLSKQTLASPEQRQQILKYYEWLTRWAERQQGKQASLEMVRPSMRLVEASSKSIREYGYWAISVKLSELIVELSSVYRDLFESDPKVMYLLAEAYLKLGQHQQANQVAQKALGMPENRAGVLGQLAPRGVGDMEAGQRFVQAGELRDRGLFDWAEAEYLEGLKVDSRLKVELREMLAHFYWEGGQFQKAAEMLAPLVESVPADHNLPVTNYDHSSVVAMHYWYQALHATSEKRLEDAFGLFQKAIEANATAVQQNPDILIGLFKIVQTEAQKSYFDQHFNEMVSHFRTLVSAEESRLAHFDVLRSASAGMGLAQACNQLAWLLANCNSHLDEAIYLSGRSIEIDPDSYAYLDTMSRCQFAAGRLQEAVDYQRRAVAKAPHDRMLNAQLSEFEAALRRQTSSPEATNEEDK